MSYPTGPPDPDGPREPASDPWATPEKPLYGQPQYEQPTYEQPQYAQPQYEQPQYEQPQYGQPGYGQPAYGQYGGQQQTNGKASAALWTGIGSLVLVLCCVGGLLGVLPIVLGVKARGEIRRSGGQQDGDGMALTGIILGSVAVVLSLALIAVVAFFIATGASTFEGYDSSGV